MYILCACSVHVRMCLSLHGMYIVRRQEWERKPYRSEYTLWTFHDCTLLTNGVKVLKNTIYMFIADEAPTMQIVSLASYDVNTQWDPS